MFICVTVPDRREGARVLMKQSIRCVHAEQNDHRGNLPLLGGMLSTSEIWLLLIQISRSLWRWFLPSYDTWRFQHAACAFADYGVLCGLLCVDLGEVTSNSSANLPGNCIRQMIQDNMNRRLGQMGLPRYKDNRGSTASTCVRWPCMALPWNELIFVLTSANQCDFRPNANTRHDVIINQSGRTRQASI